MHPLPGLPRICVHARAHPRAIRKLHLDTCDELGIEATVRAEVERLINELQQLLIGINIMQVRDGACGSGGAASWAASALCRSSFKGGKGVTRTHDWSGVAPTSNRPKDGGVYATGADCKRARPGIRVQKCRWYCRTSRASFMHPDLLLPSQDLTPRAKDSLVSFGERLSTRIFASYLRVQVGRGVTAERQTGINAHQEA